MNKNESSFVAMLTVAWLVMLFAGAGARELFVSQSNGDDAGGAGSINSPFSSLTRALQTAQSHDTITFRQGTYRGNMRIETPYLTLRGYPGEHARIDEPYGSGTDVTLRFWATAHHATMRDLEISGGNFYTVMFYSDWAYGPDRAHHGLIENCNLHSSGYDVIKITPECDNITVRNCEIHHSGLYFLANEPDNPDKNCQGIDDVNSDSLLVQDCYFHDIASQALFFKGGATDCLVERVKIERCQYGVFMGGSTDYEFHSPDVNPNYYQAIRGVVRNCLIKDIWDSGIAYDCAADCRAYNNTLIRCGTKVDGVAIRFSGDCTWDDAGNVVSPASVNSFFVNNVVIRESAQFNEWSSWFIYFRGGGTESTPAIVANSLLFDYNVYWDPGRPGGLGVANRNTPNTGGVYTSFAAWQGLPFHNPAYADRHSLYEDPCLDTSTGMPDLHSRCLSSGLEVTGLVDDFYRNPRDLPFNIGAVEELATTAEYGIRKNKPLAPVKTSGITKALLRSFASGGIIPVEYSVNITNALGRTVFRWNAGFRLLDFIVRVPPLKKGMYVISVIAPNGEKASTRFVPEVWAR